MKNMTIVDNVLVKSNDITATEIVIPDVVTCIDNRAFKDHKKLKTVVVPATVTEIGIDIFHGCTELENIIVPSDFDLFSWCDVCDTKWFKSHKEGFLILGTVLYSYIGKKDPILGYEDITVPAGITRICDCVFTDVGCESIVRLPSTVVEIDDDAFDVYNEPTIVRYDV